MNARSSFFAHPGSAMHTHFSLFEGDRNAFHDPDDPYEFSETVRVFVAGVLRHAREITRRAARVLVGAAGLVFVVAPLLLVALRSIGVPALTKAEHIALDEQRTRTTAHV